MNINIKIILLLALLFTLCACVYKGKEYLINKFTNVNINKEDEYECLCAFDIDGTISCGDPHPSIKE